MIDSSQLAPDNPMDELLTRYLNYLRFERNASPHTIRSYESDLLQFRDYLAGGDAEGSAAPHWRAGV